MRSSGFEMRSLGFEMRSLGFEMSCCLSLESSVDGVVRSGVEGRRGFADPQVFRGEFVEVPSAGGSRLPVIACSLPKLGS